MDSLRKPGLEFRRMMLKCGKFRAAAPTESRKARQSRNSSDLTGLGLVSGTAQVRHLAALIDRYAHDLDSVPIRRCSIRDVTFGHLRWNEFSDLTFENIEEAGSSFRSERSEKNGILAEHRITQAVEARTTFSRLIGINDQLRGSALYQKNSHSP
jgi:hypothetical protein